MDNLTEQQKQELAEELRSIYQRLDEIVQMGAIPFERYSWNMYLDKAQYDIYIAVGKLKGYPSQDDNTVWLNEFSEWMKGQG